MGTTSRSVRKLLLPLATIINVCGYHWFISFFVVVAVTPCLYVYQMTRVLISMFTFLKKTNHLNEMTLLPSIRLEEEHLELEELLRPTWTQVELIQWVNRNWFSKRATSDFQTFSEIYECWTHWTSWMDYMIFGCLWRRSKPTHFLSIQKCTKKCNQFFFKKKHFCLFCWFSLPFHIKHITKYGAHEISSMSKLVSVVAKNKQKQKLMWEKEEKWNRKLARLFIFRMKRNLTCIPEKRQFNLATTD